MELSAGLVIIYDNKILLEHPTGSKWYGTYSIPKGGVEKNEDILDAAVRETEEELGIKIDKNKIDNTTKEYINYKDNNGKIYKKVYYFLVKLDKPIDIDKTKIQKTEIDWAGFLTKEEAEKRIFWRLKPVLKHLDESMKTKVVKESLYEKFVADSDPIHDMGIGSLRRASPKTALGVLQDILDPFGILIKRKRIPRYSGAVDFWLAEKSTPYKSISNYLDLSFFNDEAAEMDGNSKDSGWFGEPISQMNEPTYDTEEFVRLVLKEIYGDASVIEKKIKNLENIKNYIK